MSVAIMVLNGLSVVTAVIAALNWYSAANVERQMTTQMRVNGRAASWAAVTALLQAVSYAPSVWVYWWR